MHRLTGAVIALGIYCSLCIFCLLAPVATIRSMFDLLWVFGPPANLIYGHKLLVFFVPGTMVVAAFTWALLYPATIIRRILLVFALIASWSIFGFLVYAPGT